MPDPTRTILICSCEDTIPLDLGGAAPAIARACGGTVTTGRQFCRSQMASVEAALAAGGSVTIGCTQEAPLFQTIAAEGEASADLTFVNLRETGGWSDEGAQAGPKWAALIAAAAVPMPETAFVTLESRGVALVYGRDETAFAVAKRLAAEELDVTVLLTRPGAVTPAAVNEAPVAKGTIVAATGWLGAFDLTVDDYAQPAPSSRAALAWGPARNGAVSQCDLVVDVSGGMALFPAGELRVGYLRADPGDRAGVERVTQEAIRLVGTFDKPRYVTYRPELCAHSRSKKTGCTRCLDLCPTGAITPAGDAVAIQAEICAGCGACAAVCPTGAASYALPPADATLRRLRAALLAYAEAGGTAPVVLLHDADHGAPLIDALARFGAGLPARVIPLAVHEVTQIGLDLIAAAFAHGAAGLFALTRARPKHDVAGLDRNLDTANALLEGLGYGDGACARLATDDPDELGAALRRPLATRPTATPSRFRAMGTGRDLLVVSLRELAHAAPGPLPETPIPLPARAPIGRAKVEVEGCTLCLACVSACPVAALTAHPDRPMLRFQEDLCVQCGLCAATCPEKVITLEPQLDLAAWAAGPVVVKEEEPFACISCSKPFGTKSSVERIVARLEGKHWMFSGENAKRISIVKMCEDCRVEVVVNESFDPHATIPRPAPRTTEDYLRERAERGGEDSLN